MNKRFILIVLDSFGIGEMDDTKFVRPADIGANTCLHLLDNLENVNDWFCLEKLGLMNTIGKNVNGLNIQDKAIFGKSKLKHYGADTFFGHHEIAGTDPKKPIFQKFNSNIDDVEMDLKNNGYNVERVYRGNIAILKVDNQLCIGDNIETDPGQAINVTASLDDAGRKKIQDVGHIVRKHYQVPRIIAFGGSDVSIDDILRNIVKKGDFIGIDAPGSGVYNKNYHVIHIGYGIDSSVQVMQALKDKSIKATLYGKVADIVENPAGDRKPGVDTRYIFNMLKKDLEKNEEGFYFVNIQETDLAGHAQDPKRYLDVLKICNNEISEIINMLTDDDILLVTADHGNDPFIGHSKHTREFVPIMIYKKNNNKLIDLGTRDTLSDLGATVADFFSTHIKNGKSFLDQLK